LLVATELGETVVKGAGYSEGHISLDSRLIDPVDIHPIPFEMIKVLICR
jgi:hypothetical protein